MIFSFYLTFAALFFNRCCGQAMTYKTLLHMLEENNIENPKMKNAIVEDLSGINEILDMQPTTSHSTAHDDFDWSLGKKNTLSYSKEQKEDYLKTTKNIELYC